MLQFNREPRVIEGVTVFPDHIRDDLFWYMPGPDWELARRGSDEEPQFTLITYRPAVADSDVKGGGFLTMEVALQLDEVSERRIKSRLAGEAGGNVTLSPVMFDEGSVRIIALDLEGSGGTSSTLPPGTFRAVENILGATTPSMGAEMRAVFSLTLSQEGAIILSQAFTEGGKPVGVIGTFKYTGLREALDVKITANYKRIYDHLSLGIDLTAGALVSGVPIYLDIGIDLAFEKLIEDGVIDIQVNNFSTEEDKSGKEQWALDFFKNDLLKDWFKPTLPPIKPNTQDGGGTGTGGGGTGTGGGSTGAGGDGTGTGSGSTGAGGDGTGTGSGGTGTGSGGTGAGGDGTGTGSGGTGTGGGSTGTGGDGTGTGSGGTGTGGGGTGTGNSGGSSDPGGGSTDPGGGSSGSGGESPVGPAALPMKSPDAVAIHDPLSRSANSPATLNKTISNGVAGRDVILEQQADSNRITLRFTGDISEFELDGIRQTLDSENRFSFDLLAADRKSFVARFRASSSDTFRLLFDFEKPDDPGWPNNPVWRTQPPSPVYASYLNNFPSPADSAFMSTSNGGSERGSAALQAWLTEAPDVPVRIEAHASFENDTTKRDYNRALSERRMEVAEGIIGSTVPISSATRHGFSRAQGEGRSSDPNDRVAEIHREINSPETVINGTVFRPATDNPGGDNPGGDNPGGDNPGGDNPGGDNPGGDNPGGDNPGGDSPGGDSPGGDNPGGDSPGGDSPGGGNTPDIPDLGVKLAFRLQKIEQIEDKNVTLHYNRRDAQQRVYAPQSLLGLLTEDLSGPPHFINVDLDDPFFRKLSIEVDSPVDFNAIGLVRSDLMLEYGDVEDPRNLKREELKFERGGASSHKRSFFLNDDLDLEYRTQTQYHFDPATDWEGASLSYEMPVESTLDRTLLVNPYNHLGFLTVRIVPGDLDRGIITDSEVTLRYDDGDWSTSRTFAVRPDSSEQFWQLRLSKPDHRTFNVSTRHHLIDGTVRESPAYEQQSTTVTVNDPFENPLIVEFFPTYNDTDIQILFVDVLYEDTANSYSREERLQFRGIAPQSQRLRIARFDATHSEFSFRITRLALDNAVTRLPPVETESTIIFLGEHLETE